MTVRNGKFNLVESVGLLIENAFSCVPLNSYLLME